MVVSLLGNTAQVTATLRCRSTASQATPSPFASFACSLLRYRLCYGFQITNTMYSSSFILHDGCLRSLSPWVIRPYQPLRSRPSRAHSRRLRPALPTIVAIALTHSLHSFAHCGPLRGPHPGVARIMLRIHSTPPRGLRPAIQRSEPRIRALRLRQIEGYK